MEKQNAAPKAPGEQQLDGIGNNAKTEDFRMKNKVYEIIKYGNIALKDFPKYERATLAREIRQSMYTILRLVITLENKHYKKTTLGELDTEVDVLRHFIRLAADEEIFAAYHAGEMDREKMNRTVASYKGILKHFNSHGMAQKLNDIYRREVMGNAAN